MSDDEISDEEMERRMSAKLFGGRVDSVKVETRRSGRKPAPVVEVEAKPIPIEHGGDDAFVYVFHAVTPDGRRIHLKSLRGDAGNDPQVTVRQLEEEGRIVKWIGARPEEWNDE